MTRNKASGKQLVFDVFNTEQIVSTTMGSLRKVVITGAAGFLGLHLAKRLLAQNAIVIGLDNGATGDLAGASELSRICENFRLIPFDVCQPWSNWFELVPPRWLDGLTHVFHMASPASPKHYQSLSLETMRVNSEGTDRALTMAQALGARLIFASSSEVYGFSDEVPYRESNWGLVNPRGMRSCYVESKRFGEALVDHFNRRNESNHGVVRIFNTYGPGMAFSDGRVIINLLNQALRDEAVTIYGSGQQTRSFCYVEDLISGLVRYAESGLSAPMNLGNDHEYSINDLVASVEAILGRTLSKKYSELPENDPPRRRPDLTFAREALAPWTPQVSLEEGLSLTLDWLKSQKVQSFLSTSLST